MTIGPLALQMANGLSRLLRLGLDPSRVLGDWIGNGDLATCGIIRVEVLRGIRSKVVRERMERFLNLMREIPTTGEIWREAGHLAWKLDRSGIVLPAQDVLIATCARSIGPGVLTDDGHFHRVPGCIVLEPGRELGLE